jgi:rod shape-determining protein MreD
VKRIAAFALLVFAVPMLQGVLARFLPAALHPDLGLLVVFGLSLCWRNTATGLIFAAVCGFVVDLFSGGLLGQHALLSVLVFAAARMLSGHVSMIGVIPQMVFAAALATVYAVVMAALTSFFTGAGFAPWNLGALAPYVAINAVIAPIVAAVVSGLAAWIAGEDAGRGRPLRLATRSWAA